MDENNEYGNFLTRLSTFNVYVENAFRRYGIFIVRRTAIFIIIPLVLSTVASFGFLYTEKLYLLDSSEENADFWNSWQSSNGVFEKNRRKIVAIFNDTRPEWNDIAAGYICSVFLTLKRNDKNVTIFNDAFITEYLWLRNAVESIKVAKNIDQWYTYADLCGQDGVRLLHDINRDSHRPQCRPDIFVTLTEIGFHNYKSVFNSSYPVASFTSRNGVNNTFSLGSTFSEVQLSPLKANKNAIDFGRIAKARGVVMTFDFNLRFADALIEWRSKFVELMTRWSTTSPFSNVKAVWYAWPQAKSDFVQFSSALARLTWPLVVTILAVSILIASSVADWVYSKPLLAVCAIASPALAIITGFGMVQLCHIEMPPIVHLVVFAVLPFSIHQFFVMLAGWRSTAAYLPVKERLSESTSKISHVILLNYFFKIFCFLIGSFSNVPALQTFCIYTASCLIFACLFQMTIFTTFCYFSGLREFQNRHCLFLHRIESPIRAGKHTPLWYRIFCTGGDDFGIGPVAQSCSINIFVKKITEFSIFQKLTSLPKKFYISLLSIFHLMYISISFWAFVQLDVDCIKSKIFLDNSISSEFIKNRYSTKLFDLNNEYLDIVIGPDVKYSNWKVRKDLLEFVRRLSVAPFVYDYDFWLEDFLGRHSSSTINSESEFMRILQSESRMYADRLRLSFGQIDYSRILVTIRNNATGNNRQFADAVFETIKEFTYFPLTLYHRRLAEDEQGSLAAFETWRFTMIVFFFCSVLFLTYSTNCKISLILIFTFISVQCGVFGTAGLTNLTIDAYATLSVICVNSEMYFYSNVIIWGYKYFTNDQVSRNLCLQCFLVTLCSSIVLLSLDCYLTRTMATFQLAISLITLYHLLILLPVLTNFFNLNFYRITDNKNGGTNDHHHALPIATVSGAVETCTNVESGGDDRERRVFEEPDKTVVRNSLEIVNQNRPETASSCYSQYRSNFGTGVHRRDCRQFLTNRLTIYDIGLPPILENFSQREIHRNSIAQVKIVDVYQQNK